MLGESFCVYPPLVVSVEECLYRRVPVLEQNLGPALSVIYNLAVAHELTLGDTTETVLEDTLKRSKIAAELSESFCAL